MKKVIGTIIGKSSHSKSFHIEKEKAAQIRIIPIMGEENYPVIRYGKFPLEKRKATGYHSICSEKDCPICCYLLEKECEKLKLEEDKESFLAV